MKFDLMFSDLVALLCGLFGFLATAITLQKALLHYQFGVTTTGISMGLFGLVLLIMSRAFLLGKPYDRMMGWAVTPLGRFPFLLLCAFFWGGVALVFATTSDHDLIGAPRYLPWLFTLEAVGVLLLFFLVAFLVPGLAFRPYRAARRARLAEKAAIEAQAAPMPTATGTTARPQSQPKPPLPRWLRILVGTAALLGCMPVLALKFGFGFLPSAEWAETTRDGAYAATALCAIIFTGLMVYAARRNVANQSIATRGFVILLAPVFGAVLGAIGMTVGIPMALTLATGTQTSQTYVMSDRHASSTRRCKNPVPLDGLIFMFDRICGTSENFRNSLQPGDQVVVSGFGSAYGVFGRNVITAPTNQVPLYNIKRLSLMPQPDNAPILKMAVTPAGHAADGAIAAAACIHLGSITDDNTKAMIATATPDRFMIEIARENTYFGVFKTARTSYFSAPLTRATCDPDTLVEGAPAPVVREAQLRQ